MALFFDAPWFDAQLERLHLSRAHLAAMLGIDEDALLEMWKDQREVSPADVALMAALFNVAPAEVMSRAGISTRAPTISQSDAKAVLARLDALEAKIDEVLRRLPAT